MALLRSSFILLVITTTIATEARAESAEPSTRPASSTTADIGRQLAAIRRKQKAPALAAAIVRSDGETLVWADGARKSGSKHAVTTADRWHLGSCTKAMTATLCARLVDQGKLRWDMTVKEAMPDLSKSLHKSFREVTLEQLLCHRSGLPEDRRPDLQIWPRVVVLRGPLPRQRLDFLEMNMSRAPSHAPGSEYAYANAGFVIAGAMAEAATGQSYEDLMRIEIFEPLGITTGGFGPPGDAKKVDQPWGHSSMLLFYQSNAPGPGSDNPAVIAPAGTVHMSLPDWAKFARLHLRAMRGRPELLSEKAWRRLHEDPFDQDYAFGWAQGDWRRTKGGAFVHDGSNGMWYAVVLILPKSDIAILAASNAGDTAANKACDRAVKLLHKRFASTDPP
jgi:CubicO group peptidase (beta-lactamase class C family)